MIAVLASKYDLHCLICSLRIEFLTVSNAKMLSIIIRGYDAFSRSIIVPFNGDSWKAPGIFVHNYARFIPLGIINLDL